MYKTNAICLQLLHLCLTSFIDSSPSPTIHEASNFFLKSKMLGKLVTLYFLIVALSSIDCGNSFKLSPRILNGSDSLVNQFPYYVFLEIELSDGVKVCGGSLIGKFILIY